MRRAHYVQKRFVLQGVRVLHRRLIVDSGVQINTIFSRKQLSKKFLISELFSCKVKVKKQLDFVIVSKQYQ